jgi:hypothetical protein
LRDGHWASGGPEFGHSALANPKGCNHSAQACRDSGYASGLKDRSFLLRMARTDGEENTAAGAMMMNHFELPEKACQGGLSEPGLNHFESL